MSSLNIFLKGENKMTDKNKKISSTNTKKEILEAYDKIQEELKFKKEEELKPEEVKKEKKKQEVMKITDDITLDNIQKKVANLKIETGSFLESLFGNLEVEIKKYISVKEAISFRDSELKEIFEIERNATTLAALIESHRQKKEELENELIESKEKLTTEISKQKEEWIKEKKEYEEESNEKIIVFKKDQNRKKEEFEYNFKRECEKKRNDFNDEINEVERGIEIKKEIFDEKTRLKERELTDREEIIKLREEEYNLVVKKVENFEIILEKEVSKVIDETTEKLKLEQKNNEIILKKE